MGRISFPTIEPLFFFFEALCDTGILFFFKELKKHFYLFLAALDLRGCMQAFSSCGEQGYSACRVQASHCGGFSCRRARAPVVAVRGLSSCSMWALEHEGFSSCGARAPCLWRTGLVTPRHVRSSWTRARTRVPCIGRRILNHCAAREVPRQPF